MVPALDWPELRTLSQDLTWLVRSLQWVRGPHLTHEAGQVSGLRDYGLKPAPAGHGGRPTTCLVPRALGGWRGWGSRPRVGRWAGSQGCQPHPPQSQEAGGGQGPRACLRQSTPERLHLHHRGEQGKREVQSTGDTLQRPRVPAELGQHASPSAWPRGFCSITPLIISNTLAAEATCSAALLHPGSHESFHVLSSLYTGENCNSER